MPIKCIKIGAMAVTLAEAVEAFRQDLVAAGYARQTVRGYLHDLDMFLRYARPDRALASVDADLLQAYFRQLLETGLSRAAVHRKAAALRTFFKSLVRRGALGSSPFTDRVVLPRRSRRALPRVLSEDQLDRLIAAVTELHQAALEKAVGTVRDPERAAALRRRYEFLRRRDLALTTLLADAGLRVSELAGLNLEDLNLAGNGSVRVMGKGNKERMVPLNAPLCELIREYLAHKPGSRDGALFVTEAGNRLAVRSIQRLIRIVGDRCQFQLSRPLSPHKLRHAFATRLLRETGDITLVQRALGHEDITTTTIYARVADRDLEEAMARLGRRRR